MKRFKCKECGKSFTAKQEFTTKRSKVSTETVLIVLNALRKYTCTFSHAGEIAHVSNTTAMNIFDKYVNPKRRQLVNVIAMDEVYNKEQFHYPYSCVLFDFMNSKIIDVIQDRSKESLSRYFRKIKKEEREIVQYVVMDMWEPYVDIVQTFFKNATIVIDSFHVLKEINTALDKLRCRVMRRYEKETDEYALLKKYNDLLFSSHSSMNEKQYNKRFKRYVNSYDLLEMLLKIDPELNKAYTFAANYRTFNKYANEVTAREIFEKLTSNMELVKIEEFRPIIKMLRNWKEYILNSFTKVEGRRLSNGPIEGCNSQIKKLMRISNGLENVNRFRNRLMFCYNNEMAVSPASTRITKCKRKKRGKYKKAIKN